MTAELDRSFLRRALIAGSFAFPLGVALIWAEASLPSIGDIRVHLTAVCALLVGLAVGLAVGVRPAAVLHRAIGRALEGDLVPVERDRVAALLAAATIADYDTLVRRLGSLFGEMERSQVAVIEERNRNEAVLRGLPCAMLVIDSGARIRLLNPRAESLFALSAEELRGRELFDLLRQNHEANEMLRNCLACGQELSNREILLGAGENRRTFTLSVTFFRPAPQAIALSAVVMLQDVTDHRRLQEIAHQAEKFVAMGHFAGGVAHELNTPLGTIIGYAKLLTSGDAGAKNEQYARIIHQEARRCASIVDNLLAYARREHCAPETCRIDEVIRDVVETIRNCRGRRCKAMIETRFLDDPTVLGSSGQLDIVLVNLILNAVQATCDAVPDPRIVVESRVEGGNAIVSITDNGPGVPAELRGRLFEPFVTTKPSGTGTGLGLAICQSIVIRAGGTLHLDSSYRAGARFVLSLPLAKGEEVLDGDATVH